MLLSIAAALATIALKASAWLITGSVGFLSDAPESVVNLVAAIVALIAIRVAIRPPDDDHAYGHEKAEYFSAGAGGALVLVAAVGIAWVAGARLLEPQPLSDVGAGAAVSAAAAALNLVVATILTRVGREQRSITLEADGRHLMTDVWTSVGVIGGIAAVGLTGWERLDPIIALLVALNIVRTGVQLIRRSTGGLMDLGLGTAEQADIQAVLDAHRKAGVQQGHDVAEGVERDVRERLPYATVFTHVEPREDPASFDDVSLDRGKPK
jgi:cation diffusion facilitator family transporter